jgi:hypothetical protein
VASSYNPWSFDSRYFGPISESAVRTHLHLHPPDAAVCHRSCGVRLIGLRVFNRVGVGFGCFDLAPAVSLRQASGAYCFLATVAYYAAALHCLTSVAQFFRPGERFISGAVLLVDRNRSTCASLAMGLDSFRKAVPWRYPTALLLSIVRLSASSDGLLRCSLQDCFSPQLDSSD